MISFRSIILFIKLSIFKYQNKISLSLKIMLNIISISIIKWLNYFSSSFFSISQMFLRKVKNEKYSSFFNRFLNGFNPPMLLIFQLFIFSWRTYLDLALLHKVRPVNYWWVFIYLLCTYYYNTIFWNYLKISPDNWCFLV